jgi:hypothetical protein
VIAPEVEEMPSYSPAIIQFLLNKQVVTSSMIKGGVLRALRRRNDWVG